MQCPQGYSTRDEFEHLEICVEQSYFRIVDAINFVTFAAIFVIAFFNTYRHRIRLFVQRKRERRDLLLYQGLVVSIFRCASCLFRFVTNTTIANQNIAGNVLYFIAFMLFWGHVCTIFYIIGWIFAAVMGSPVNTVIKKWVRIMRAISIGIWLVSAGLEIYLIFWNSTEVYYVAMIILSFMLFGPFFLLGLRIFLYEPPDPMNIQFRARQRRIFGFVSFWGFVGLLTIIIAVIFLALKKWSFAKYLIFYTWEACGIFSISAIVINFHYYESPSRSIDSQSDLQSSPTSTTMLRSSRTEEQDRV